MRNAEKSGSGEATDALQASPRPEWPAPDGGPGVVWSPPAPGNSASSCLSRPTDLLEYVRTHFDFIRAHPHYPRLFQRMMMAGGRRGERLVAERILPVAQGLGALLRRGIRTGEFRPFDVPHTAISLVALTAIAGDLTFLLVFAALMFFLATGLFRRTL